MPLALEAIAKPMAATPMLRVREIGMVNESPSPSCFTSKLLRPYCFIPGIFIMEGWLGAGAWRRELSQSTKTGDFVGDGVLVPGRVHRVFKPAVVPVQLVPHAN
jgi:hypothetical protein